MRIDVDGGFASHHVVARAVDACTASLTIGLSSRTETTSHRAVTSSPMYTGIDEADVESEEYDRRVLPCHFDAQNGGYHAN